VAWRTAQTLGRSIYGSCGTGIGAGCGSISCESAAAGGDVNTRPEWRDLDAFRPGQRRSAWRADLGISPEALVIGNVARLDGVKNHADLLNGFAHDATAGSRSRAGDCRRWSAAARAGGTSCGLGVAQHVDSWPDGEHCRAVFANSTSFVLSSSARVPSLSVSRQWRAEFAWVATAVGWKRGTAGPGSRGPPRRNLRIPAALAAAMADLLRDHRHGTRWPRRAGVPSSPGIASKRWWRYEQE